jgi:hypothetical protein
VEGLKKKEGRKDDMKEGRKADMKEEGWMDGWKVLRRMKEGRHEGRTRGCYEGRKEGWKVLRRRKVLSEYPHSSLPRHHILLRNWWP